MERHLVDTGPISLAALVHALCALSIPALMEIAGPAPRVLPWIAEGASLVAEVTERYAPIPTFRRPDGSFTNW